VPAAPATRVTALATSLVVLAASVAWSTAAAQSGTRGAANTTPPPVSADPEPTARIVRLDAVVVDPKGRPILDLKPADFEIVESGVAQRIDAAELRNAKAAGQARAAGDAEPPIESPEDERRAAREPGTRLFALVLDEFHVNAGADSDRVREVVTRFVDEQLRPSDLLAVIKPLDSLTNIRFTRDRTEAKKAIESFSGRQGDYTARTEFEEKFIGRAPGLVRAARIQIILSALRALTMKLGDLDAGRAAVVLVSEGFAREVGRERERRVPDVQGIVRAASRHNVAVYAFDPGSAIVQSPAPAGSGAPDEPAESMLRNLATETGGEVVLDPAQLGAGLQRVARDLDAYYLLTYTSTHEADGRFYDVQVRTKRRDAVVRARTGYWAPLRTELRTASEFARSKPMRALRRSPLIQTWLGLYVQDGTQQVIFTWEPAARLPGVKRAGEPAVVGLKVTTPAGAVLYEGELRPPGEIIGSSVYADAAVFQASPGRIQADLVVLAQDGTRIDTAAHDIDVPDITKTDPLILPPQVFESRSARDFRELSANIEAAPVPRREFRRTERLLFRIPVNSPSGAAITLKARLLNRWGQVLRELTAMSASSAGATQFDLPLNWLAPGEYVVEFNATTSAGAAKEVVRLKVTG
jgi:VWFA-related protein